ncbi:MAG: DUF2461 domain-containing protein [Candidatus Neomarinimicrobiota bacterium]
MITKDTFKFLKELKKNNNREWFRSNKAAFDSAFENFYDLVAMLIHQISDFDESLFGLEPKGCIFRIYRDVRFSKNKLPYKTWFGANLKGGGRKEPGPGYYFHLDPGNSFAGGGIWHPEKETLDKIRERLVEKPREFKKVVEAPSFKKNFGELGGEKLKVAPQGYAKDHAQIQWLRHKDLVALRSIPDQTILSPDIFEDSLEIFKNIYPLNKFISAAMR